MGFAIGNNGFSFFLLLAANLFLGAGFGLLTSILNVFIVDLYPERRDTFVTGLHSCLGIGAALAPLLVSFFHEKGSWVESAYWSLGVLSLILIAASRIRAPFLGEKVGREMASHLKNPSPFSWGARLFILTVVFYGIAEAIIGNWSAVYLTREKGFSLHTASFALSFFWTFLTAGRLAATFLTLKIDSRWLYRVSPAIIVASLLMIIAIRSEDRILFSYIAVGLGCSYFFPFSLSLSSRYHDEWRESLPAFVVAGLMAGVCIGSFVIGFLRERMWIDLGQAFGIAAASASLVWFLAIYLTWEKPAPVESFSR
jgi:fucose permease